MSTIPTFAREKLESCVEATAHCTGMQMILAISYSSRWELTAAVKQIVAAGIPAEEITEAVVSNHLCTYDIPDPDLLIRTGGDCRISNYLLWQIAYAELSFTDTFWPDYSKEQFCDAILRYQSKERRFGMTSEQLK